MRFKLIFLLCLIVMYNDYSYAAESRDDLEMRLLQCRQVSSVLERLECYDDIRIGENNISANSTGKTKNVDGVAWNRAINQENLRKEHNIDLLVTKSGDINPTVLITTPALGYQFERPILMLSCIDNITRLQVALPKPLVKNSVSVTLTTDKTTFNSQWFVRENYFLLEASRGLDGIKEIQRLFNAKSLKIQAKDHSFNELIFNIESLEDNIKSLREACHW